MKPKAFKMVIYTNDGAIHCREREYENKTGMMASYRFRCRRAKQDLKLSAWAIYDDGKVEQIMYMEAA